MRNNINNNINNNNSNIKDNNSNNNNNNNNNVFLAPSTCDKFATENYEAYVNTKKDYSPSHLLQILTDAEVNTSTLL